MYTKQKDTIKLLNVFECVNIFLVYSFSIQHLEFFVIITRNLKSLLITSGNLACDLPSEKLICGFQFRGLPLLASGVARRTRKRPTVGDAEDVPPAEDPVTRDGSVGMLAAAL